jgi:nitronate monooxygenase
MATAALRARAAQQGDGDYMSLWAGQGYPLARRMSAAALVSAIAQEYGDAAERLLNAVRR